MTPDRGLAGRIERLVGPVASWRAGNGGYTTAVRVVATLVDGRSVFVKAAVDDETAEWLREELRVYRALSADALAEVVAVEEGDRPLLVLEDLSGAHWPPPWRDGDVERVRATLDRVHGLSPPPGLPRPETSFGNGWSEVAADPDRFLRLELAEGAWLERCLEVLAAATNAAPLHGGQLIHLDVRSDNLCLDHDRVVLVDWNFASIGNPALDLVTWAPSLALEGRPDEASAQVRDQGQLLAWLAGFWACRAGLPPPHDGSTVRDFQRRQLDVTLSWTCHELDLPPPTP